MLVAIAFAEVGLDAAALLFGSHTVLSRSGAHVRHRLLRLVQPSALVFNSPRRQSIPRDRPLSNWVYALALYEMWSYIEDPELAEEALTTSIAYRDFGDVRTGAPRQCASRRGTHKARRAISTVLYAVKIETGRWREDQMK